MEHSIALRAEWFARLSEVIDGAQQVAWHLRTDERVSSEARELYDRLEAAKCELKRLKEAAAQPALTSESY